MFLVANALEIKKERGCSRAFTPRSQIWEVVLSLSRESQ